MANPQPDQFTRLSNELYEAIMKTDFSKRQRNILDLILRMSYGCRKKFAILRPSDFEVVGVLRGHIKKELDYLQMANVLHIEGEVFSLNKDYDSWRVSITKGFDSEKYQKILGRNIVQNVTETVTKVTEMVTKNDDEFDEKLPKQEQGCYQNSNSAVTKTVTGTPSETLQDKGSRVPKDIIKESIKDSSSAKEIYMNQDTEQTSAARNDFSYSRIYQLYENNFTKNGRVTEFEVQDLNDQFETYGGEWLLEAMREAVRHDKKNLAYINGVLTGYRERGGPKKEQSGTTAIQKPREQAAVGHSVPGADETQSFLNDIEMRIKRKQEFLQQRAGP